MQGVEFDQFDIGVVCCCDGVCFVDFCVKQFGYLQFVGWYVWFDQVVQMFVYLFCEEFQVFVVEIVYVVYIGVEMVVGDEVCQGQLCQ